LSIRIVTDSTSDLPEKVVAEHGITVIPAYINIGDKSLLDGAEISRQEFYEKLPDYAPPPKTSAPGTGTFIEIYEQLAAAGAGKVLSVHISATLSGFLNAAQSAAQTVQSVRVTVFDSTQLTMGTGFLALAAAQAAEAGHTMAEIVDMLRDKAARIYSFAALDTLEFLRRGGRLNRLQSSLGTLLKIKPLLTMHNGELVMEKVRTYRKMVARLGDLTNGLAPLENLALVHANALEKVQALWERFRHLVPHIKAPIITEVTPAIGAHVGPGAVGLVCVKARKK
jgi:DegV family protein with EDD domain